MTPLRPFPDLVAQLLRDLRLDMPAGPAQEVYSLHFDGQPSVHLIGRTGAAHIDVITEAARLPQQQAAGPLLALLELNVWDDRSVTATIMVHRASRTILVGARQLRATVDVPLLKLVLEGVRRRADAVRQRLGDSSMMPGPRNADTLARMARFIR